VYAAIGVSLDGEQDILGLRAGSAEFAVAVTRASHVASTLFARFSIAVPIRVRGTAGWAPPPNGIAS
jgi:transposase-like protein